MFCPSLHLNSVDADNNKIFTHHFVVRVDDWRSRRSAGEHGEKGGDGYVAYHLQDEAHLSSFPKKITNTICNTRERSMFSTNAGKFHANWTTINRTVSKSNFPSGSHTAIGYWRLLESLRNIRGIFVRKYKFHRWCLHEVIEMSHVVEQIEIPLADVSDFFSRYRRGDWIENSTEWFRESVQDDRSTK